MSHRTSSSIFCQTLLAAGLLAGPAAAADPAPSAMPATPNPAAPDLEPLFRRLAKVRLFGAASLNWRNVGPREPGFETQIQNQVYLADLYVGAEGPVGEGIPVRIEWNLPTAGRGVPRLSQAFVEYNRIRRIKFQLGKFMVPFGRYNELYRPDQYLAVTRPCSTPRPTASISWCVRTRRGRRCPTATATSACAGAGTPCACIRSCRAN
ncbi:MAG: hypothetical protein M0D55_04110 [Elusimicrobiota bacterium]|nr:MAG: hypothetical protein M0D55_04110 [Elusimicrobiota bacterium]